MAASHGGIDRSLPVPLYHQLEDVIRRDIENGVYTVGDLLPSESEIGARYDLSRSVVRQALAHLAQAGVIRTERGRGSFVAEQKLSERFVQRTTGFYDDLTRMGLRVHTTVLRQEIAPAPREARDFLRLDEVVRIDRLRSVEGRVLAYVRTYISPERCPGLERYDLADRSLYAHLREVYGLRVHAGFRTVEAVAADGEIAEHLEVSPGTPLLLLCSASRTEDGEPLEWFAAWHRADRTRFEVEIAPGAEVRPFEPAVIASHEVAAELAPDDLAGSGTPTSDIDGTAVFAGRLAAERMVAVVSAPRYAHGGLIARALADGGIGIAKFSLTGEGAFDAIAQARAAAPDMLVGAGSVLSVEQAQHAVRAGAQFVAAPARVPGLVDAGLQVPVVLSGYTPSEVLDAHTLTGGPVQVSPAPGGGVEHFAAVAATLPGIPMVASGGVDEGNLADFLAAGAVAVNLGPSLCPVAAVTDGDARELTRRAVRARRAVHQATAGVAP